MSIEVKDLSYTYSPKTPFAKVALDNVSFSIKDGETCGIIGSTGSGKSTLVQHLNGLIKVQNGSVTVCGCDLAAKKPDYKKVRAKVGMLFQYPEYQLFEDTVLKDVAFGPQNFGYSKEEAYRLSEEAIKSVGLDFDEIKDKSPFELSGGQKRRVAIAGIIASKPEVLVLDEPTAGLDPVGKKEILDLVTNLKKSSVKIVVMISHNMDEIAEYCDHIIVLHNSKLTMDGTPAELFSDINKIKENGLRLPHVSDIRHLLVQKGFDISNDALSVQKLFDEIKRNLGGYVNE